MYIWVCGSNVTLGYTDRQTDRQFAIYSRLLKNPSYGWFFGPPFGIFSHSHRVRSVARWDPPHIIRSVKLCLHAQVLACSSILFSDKSITFDFFFFLKYRKGCGHIDMPRHSPVDTDSKYIGFVGLIQPLKSESRICEQTNKQIIFNL